MNNNEKNVPCQLLLLIATPKLAGKAEEMFLNSGLPVQYRMNAKGTASSEIMDTLGLGSIDKCLLAAMLTKSQAKAMLKQLHSKLRLDAVNSGIAFTITLTGATRLLMRMVGAAGEQNAASTEGKGDSTVAEDRYTLIAAIVDRGFGGNVMDAAREAGAGGGTIVHSRGIETQEATAFWGLSMQEEKEIVLIIAEHDSKLKIMSTIGEKCGMNTEAKGLVLSLPIDSVMGI